MLEVVYRGIAHTLPLPQTTRGLICTVGIYLKLTNFSWYYRDIYVPDPNNFPDKPLRDLGIGPGSIINLLPKFEYCRSCLSQGRIYKVPDSCQVGYCSECLGFEPSEQWLEDCPELSLYSWFKKIVPGMNTDHLINLLWGFLLTRPELMKKFKTELSHENFEFIIRDYLKDIIRV